MKSLRKSAIITLESLGGNIENVPPGFSAAFTNFDGVDGELIDPSEEPAWGIRLGDPTTSVASLARSDAGPGRLSFRRDLDSASPLLTRWARENHRFGTLEFLVLNCFGKGHLKYELTGAVVYSFTIPSMPDPDGLPAEELTLQYRKIAAVGELTEPGRRTGSSESVSAMR